MDAVRDLDDPLTMVHLFATLPAEKLHGIPAAVVQTSRRLALEWQVWRLLAMSRTPCFLRWTESVHAGIANPSEPVNPSEPEIEHYHAVYEWHRGPDSCHLRLAATGCTEALLCIHVRVNAGCRQAAEATGCRGEP